MASIIKGYKYDVFISYRQKDNKHDGWVTEFVSNLKGELESTFKEDVSVYFDINPHDGLLETHDVDDSLKEKLKCLVFIPIVSRTYCDPKSFAWEHEFKAFIEQASKDQFGLKVRLPNGNVSSRVLPIHIHALESDDIKLCESALSGVLRGVDFIFKSPGVNRPLRAKEEKLQENLNNTIYIDQINKVANAVKEVISGLNNPFRDKKETSEETNEGKHLVKKSRMTKIIASALIFLAFLIAGYIIISRLIKPPEHLDKSIAVLPFHNYSGDPNQEYMSDGLTDEIIGHLYKIKTFDKVVSLSSVLTYKGTEKRLPQIANDLKVNYILEGTYKKIGDSVRVTAQLIEPKNDKHLWLQEYNHPFREITSIQADIALKIADHIKAFLTTSERQNIQRNPTTNQEAYNLIQKAKYIYNSGILTDSLVQMMNLVKKAIELDPVYSDAYAFGGSVTLLKGAWLGEVEMQSVIWEAESYFEKALKINPNNGSAHLGMAMINELIKWDYIEAEKEYLEALELLPNEHNIIAAYAEFLIKRDRRDDARTFIIRSENLLGPMTRISLRSGILSFNKSEAYHSIKDYQMLYGMHFYEWVGENFIWIEEYDSAIFYLESALVSGVSYIDAPRFQADLALSYFKTNNIKQSQAIINKLRNYSRNTSAGNPDYFIGWYYSGIGEIDTAFYWLEEAYRKRSPEMPWLKADPILNSLKKDNRYWNLYERTGHKEYDDFIKGKNEN